MSSLSLLSFNARGLRKDVKRKALFLFAKQFKTDFVFVQESHSVTNDCAFWRSQWGNTVWLSHGSEHAAGVTNLKNKFNGEILLSKTDPNGHYICQVLKLMDLTFITCNIYGYNSRQENEILVITIEDIITDWFTKFSNAILLIGGDFNVTINSVMDKWPPGLSNNANAYFKRFMEKFDLEDVWRTKFPNTKMFTWSNKAGSNQSRIDFWLVSKGFDINNIEVDISPTPLTDHKAIYIKIQLSTQINHPRSAFWKLNSSLLSNEEVKKEVANLITLFWTKAKNEEQFCKYWELLKFELGKFLRKFSCKLVKSRKAKELNIVSSITNLTSKPPDTLSEEENIELSKLQLELDEIYTHKARGAFVRSRAKWLEEGEQNSHYFFNLEKYHSNLNTINKLNIDGDLTSNFDSISKYCSRFYGNLNSSNFCQTSTSAFLDSLTVKTFNEDQRLSCDHVITIEEVEDAIKSLKNNKSPGIDGLVSEFYKMFSAELAPFLFEVFLECITKEQLTTTMTQGLITLIPKPSKDITLIDNWRPISLLNNDYKIFALIFAKRLKMVLDSIIEETQSGFMTKRHITNNIRLVIDILDYAEMLDDNAFILFLDFYKAFDTVEHQFILQSLTKFGFGNFFYSAIKTLYTNGNSSIRLSGGTSQRFNLSRGIRQGCPASAYLFLIVAQLLSYHIKANTVEGISLFDKKLADDTTLFLKNEKTNIHSS